MIRGRDLCPGLPCNGETQMVIYVVVTLSVDAETIIAEVTDVDTEITRTHCGGANIDVLEQSLTSGQEMPNDTVDHQLGTRNFRVLADHFLLCPPVCIGRAF